MPQCCFSGCFHVAECPCVFFVCCLRFAECASVVLAVASMLLNVLVCFWFWFHVAATITTIVIATTTTTTTTTMLTTNKGVWTSAG